MMKNILCELEMLCIYWMSGILIAIYIFSASLYILSELH